MRDSRERPAPDPKGKNMLELLLQIYLVLIVPVTLLLAAFAGMQNREPDEEQEIDEPEATANEETK
jgi:hypothetical protein